MEGNRETGKHEFSSKFGTLIPAAATESVLKRVDELRVEQDIWIGNIVAACYVCFSVFFDKKFQDDQNPVIENYYIIFSIILVVENSKSIRSYTLYGPL